jgi:hypothetical protein
MLDDTDMRTLAAMLDSPEFAGASWEGWVLRRRRRRMNGGTHGGNDSNDKSKPSVIVPPRSFLLTVPTSRR